MEWVKNMTKLAICVENGMGCKLYFLRIASIPIMYVA